jgi:hypothetical protein
MQQGATTSFSREEALLIACLLALTGGYLEAYTWIVHRVFANAQTANLILLWANVIDGDWNDARRFILSLLASELQLGDGHQQFPPDSRGLVCGLCRWPRSNIDPPALSIRSDVHCLRCRRRHR